CDDVHAVDLDPIQFKHELQHRHIGTVVDNLADIAKAVIAQYCFSGAQIGHDNRFADLRSMNHGGVEYRVVGNLRAKPGVVYVGTFAAILPLLGKALMPCFQALPDAHPKCFLKNSAVRLSARLAAASSRRAPNSAAKP